MHRIQQTKSKQLLDNIREGKEEEVRESIIAGAHVNAVEEYKWTNLHWAAGLGYKDIVTDLLEKGAKVDQKTPNGDTALLLAAEQGYKDIVTALLEKGANVDQKTARGYTALLFAAKNGYKDIVTALLEKGAKVDEKAANRYTAGYTALLFAAEKGYKDIVTALLEKGAKVDEKTADGYTALLLAAEKGYEDIVTALLEKGANVNAEDRKGRTPLRIAAENGSTKVVKLLMKAGADFNAKDSSGLTLLHYAAEQGYTDIVKLLIEKGVDVDVVCGTTTPLDMAITWHSTEAAKALIKAGANIDIRDNTEPSLHIAVYMDNGEIVEALIKAGADVNAEDLFGYVALQQSESSTESYNLIINHIARLEAADLYVSGTNLREKNEFVDTSHERSNNYLQHLRNCEKEVERVKRENKPLHDFLKESDINELISMWERNADIQSQINNHDNLKEQYPEYAYILINKANEVKKEIFLHNHKPVIDCLSTHYERDFQTMTFAGIENFFKVHRDDFKRELGGGGITLFTFVDCEDITARHIVPKLTVQGFAEGIRSNALCTNLESPNAEQTQGASQSLN
ncbi:hypothetical protein JTE90_027152 [Oedothorax gibbosus]|uniref:Uncharacterized protein n=1 Tax=Oedothorax gibbosus TaxID=931172 RepID=A0AAV6TS35_9ARAC|nr:hypothetical protein JTE90_027152 [Oedothorax gibbosus]